MSMLSPPANSSPEGPYHQVIAVLVGRTPGTIDDVVHHLWGNLSQQLSALIGHEGCNALFDRSLHMTSAQFPWLTSHNAPFGERVPLEVLKSALQPRDSDESARAVILLLSTFTGLLCMLIGQNLTTNILRTAWGDAFEEALREISQ